MDNTSKLNSLKKKVFPIQNNNRFHCCFTNTVLYSDSNRIMAVSMYFRSPKRHVLVLFELKLYEKKTFELEYFRLFNTTYGGGIVCIFESPNNRRLQVSKCTLMLVFASTGAKEKHSCPLVKH